jgi:hypothetical protein
LETDHGCSDAPVQHGDFLKLAAGDAVAESRGVGADFAADAHLFRWGEARFGGGDCIVAVYTKAGAAR